MRMNINSLLQYLKHILVIILCCAFVSSFAFTNAFDVNDTLKTSDFDIKNASFLLPQALPAGKYSSSIYLMSVFIPPDWTLDMIKAPMISYAGKYTLPA